MINENPFTLAQASGFTDKQINSFWTDLGSSEIIKNIFEPSNRMSKFILGGKGTGKTHLLRYYSYNVTRLREPDKTGIEIVKESKFLAVFLRATGVDASRFEASSSVDINWQMLFGIYLELKLTEQVLDALCDIKETSTNEDFNDNAFIAQVKKSIPHEEFEQISTVLELKNWLVAQRKIIDSAVNDAAFTGEISLKAPFAFGALCLTISDAIQLWNSSLKEITLFYLIDEIENFSFKQQQVVNTLIRYGESRATFRVTGRQYAIKTYSTLANGEDNRINSEFKTIILDELLLKLGGKFSVFAENLIYKRLSLAGKLVHNINNDSNDKINARNFFEEINADNYFTDALSRLKIKSDNTNFIEEFERTLKQSYKETQYFDDIECIISTLTKGFPLVIQKLNIMLYIKKFKKGKIPVPFAESINLAALEYLDTKSAGFFYNAYGHYANDIFAQLCKSSASGIGVVYAGFDTLIKMTSSNPRNLLIILGKIYDVANFRGVNFLSEEEISIEIQTEAVLDSARFMYEADTNFGLESDIALRAIDRLATILRTARYAMNIPEVSPLAFSFSSDDLNEKSTKILQDALNYSLLFEVTEGRSDRNSERIIRKIQLNPMLSPKWSLPVSRRGDISLNAEMLAAIFSSEGSADFDHQLKRLNAKWNSITKPLGDELTQGDLFND